MATKPLAHCRGLPCHIGLPQNGILLKDVPWPALHVPCVCPALKRALLVVCCFFRGI